MMLKNDYENLRNELFIKILNNLLKKKKIENGLLFIIL